MKAAIALLLAALSGAALAQSAAGKLTDAEREVARRVYVGEMQCELGATVRVTRMKREGFFLVATRGARFEMRPVVSATGAIRLEDGRRGGVWLQLANKSMLMNQRQGKRLADECKSPEQAAVAESQKTNPPPKLFELDPPTK